MTQLGLDFDAKPARGPGPERGEPPDRGAIPVRSGSACILVRELARIARETGRERKILVTRTRGEGKELLRQVVLGGQSWAGFEVTTVRPLAMKYAADALARAGKRVLDAFDEQALAEEAIDRAMAGGAAGAGGTSGSWYAGLAEKVGFRDAVRNSLTVLRLGGIHAAALRDDRGGASRRQTLLRAVVEHFEKMLESRNRADAAVMLETAIRVAGVPRGEPGVAAGESGAAAGVAAGVRAVVPADVRAGVPADVPVFLVPGLSDRGLTGRFLRALEQRGATVLRTDPVVGLAVPRGILWDTGPPESAGSHLHAVEEWNGAEGRPAQPRIELFSAGSVHDELRGVLRRVIDRGARWDEVEIVASDPAMYGSALHALADSMGIPVTFAVGLPVERTRPGRVVATYFKWIESGFQESVFRALVEAGDVSPPAPHDRIAGPRLARALRRVRIGWGRERYMSRIGAVLRGLPAMQPGRYEDDERFSERKMRKEKELRGLLALLGPVLESTPEVRAPKNGARGAPSAGGVAGASSVGKAAGVSPSEVATGVKSLLVRVTGGTATDDTARDRLVRILDRIEATLTRRTDFPAAAAIVRSLLAIRIPAPRTEGTAPWSSAAGHLHLSDLRHGGAAGRPLTFVVGLDSTRFPGSAIEDPLLLDRERLRLGQGELAFAGDRASDARFNLAQLVARLRGSIVLSYARWDPAEARALSPAPELLQALRLMQCDRTLNFEDLDRHLGVTESRLPREDPRADLDACDVWLRALATSDGRLRDGVRSVGLAYPRLGQGLAAAAALERDRATVHTGIIEARDPPLSYHDLRGRILSASRLESLGACPRRFLFANVLRVSPPNDPEFDPHRWLDALQRGSLLHDVYEHTLRQARERGIDPVDDAFLALALERADREVARMTGRVPSPSPVVREIETRGLRDDVHSFVEMIRSAPPPWTALEMDFGMDDVGVEVPAGEAPVRVRGRIDRVDDHGTHLRVVDYKTGSDYGHDRKSGVYRGGRRLQHALYTAAAAAVQGKPVDYMEYHFPTRRGENRIRRYAVPDLQHGGALVAMMLEGAAMGWFPATDDADDCRFCDYQDMCGVRPAEWGKPSCRFAEWTERNLATVPELSALRRARNWKDEEPLL